MSNDKIKLPVRVSELYDLGIVDADGTLITRVVWVKFDNSKKTKTIARRDEIIHKHNGYNVAVKALTAISECRVRRPNSVAEQALRDLGELDG